MKKQDFLSVLITFCVGLFVGGYFYLVDFATFVERIMTSDEDEISELVIIGEVYGGCRNTCPSFRIGSDGSYRYLYTPSAGSEKVIREGKITRNLQRQLRSDLKISSLSRQSQTLEPAICNSYTDGIDVRYDITVDGYMYTLDSCGTDVEPESNAWVSLQSIWNFFERSK